MANGVYLQSEHTQKRQKKEKMKTALCSLLERLTKKLNEIMLFGM